MDPFSNNFHSTVQRNSNGNLILFLFQCGSGDIFGTLSTRDNFCKSVEKSSLQPQSRINDIHWMGSVPLVMLACSVLSSVALSENSSGALNWPPFRRESRFVRDTKRGLFRPGFHVNLSICDKGPTNARNLNIYLFRTRPTLM